MERTNKSTGGRARKSGVRILFLGSILFNVLLIAALLHIDRNYEKLWIERCRAENRAKLADQLLDMTQQTVDELQPGIRPKPSSDSEWRQRALLNAAEEQTQVLRDIQFETRIQGIENAYRR